MSNRLFGNRILFLEMPSWLRGTRFEDIIRTVARGVKKLSADVERRLRFGKVLTTLPSTEISVWLDYDFATKVPIPEEDKMLASFISSLHPGYVVYDIGAFGGWYTIAAFSRLGPSGRAFCFEPDPNTASMLHRHLDLNNVSHLTRVVEAACSNCFGFISMPIWPLELASGNSLMEIHQRSERPPKYVDVPLIPLDEFWETSKVSPNVIKIDVEGAELWVLEGARKILSTARPTVFMEIHKFAWHLFGTTDTKLQEFLETVSYKVSVVYPSIKPVEGFPERGFVILKPEIIEKS